MRAASRLGGLTVALGMVALATGHLAGADKAPGQWLKEAKAALERLQGAVGAQKAGAPETLAANLVSALAQAHRHTVAASRQGSAGSDSALREVHAALLELARAEATYRNLTEVEAGPAAGDVVLAGFAEARNCLSEASFGGHRLQAQMSVEAGARRATVRLRNGGQRPVKAVRITLIGGQGWVVTPVGKWTFPELPAGEQREVVFSLKLPEQSSAGKVKLVARLSFYDYFGRAVVEREQEAKLR